MRTSKPDSAFSFPAQLDPKIKPIDYLAYLKDEFLEKMNSSFEKDFTADVLKKMWQGDITTLTDKQMLSLRRMVEKYKVAEHVSQGYLFAGYAGATTLGKAVAVKSTKMSQANDDDDGYVEPDDIPNF